MMGVSIRIQSVFDYVADNNWSFHPRQIVAKRLWIRSVGFLFAQLRGVEEWILRREAS